MSGAGDDLRFDFERAKRIGLPEAVLSSGKTTAQLDEILAQNAEQGAPLLLTRLSPSARSALRLGEPLDYDPRSETAFANWTAQPAKTGRVAIVAAGSTDARTAREALRTLAFHHEEATLIMDVGVAGLWRLLERADEIASYPVAIVVAGMDAALPSVLGGLTGGLVIAAPTSTGYGVAAGGRAALDSCLASCAPGVVVCNIDNGYGAACAALRALRSVA